MQITFEPIATANNSRTTLEDDFWGIIISEITLLPHIPSEAFLNIEGFSHLNIIFYFNQWDNNEIVYSRRPRGNPDYPETGIFAQRNMVRPNRIGLTIVELLEHKERTIKVKYLDAVDGTPILDIKPVFKEFNASSDIKQPAWVLDLMKDYWK